MKKQLIAALLALGLAVPFSTAALAANIDQDSNPPSQDVTVQSSIRPAYSVTIPGDMNINAGQLSTNFGTVGLTSARLDPGYGVTVTLQSDYRLDHSTDPSKTIAYAVRSGGQDFASATYTAAGQSNALTIDIDKNAWQAAAAGDYSDTMTFAISYGPLQP